MDQGASPLGRPGDGTPLMLKGLEVRITVQCVNHGSHTATMRGPFLPVIDAVRLFREAATRRGKWVISEYRALDEVPECVVSEWV